MDSKIPIVVRVFSNNAVLAVLDGTEQVVVGRGVGFGVHAGDRIERGTHRHYVEVDPDRIGFLQTLHDVPTKTLDVLSQALDMASDMLGELHPSVYVVLADHLVFAVQRLKEGQVIHNTLKDEIRAVFPVEFSAAETVLHYINANLGTELPDDEAAFIALHLNAARTGVTVKQPLEQANMLAQFVSKIGAKFGNPTAPTDQLISILAQTKNRLREEKYRTNAAVASIKRDLSHEYDVAYSAVLWMTGWKQVPREAVGEVAFLAVALHGWRQEH